MKNCIIKGIAIGALIFGCSCNKNNINDDFPQIKKEIPRDTTVTKKPKKVVATGDDSNEVEGREDGNN